MEKESSSDLAQEEKEKWQKFSTEVNETADKLGMPIDEGIKETVVALKANDFETTGSCEGHLEHGVGSPWVDFQRKGIESLIDERYSVVEKYIKNNDENNKDLDKLNDEIEKKNSVVINKLFGFLDEFYSNRKVPFDQRLIVHPYVIDNRLENQGATTIKSVPLEKRGDKLNEYKKEMNDFTQFLKKKI